MTILDRYVIRQILMPFVLGLLVFTFFLIIPGLMRHAEDFITKGASLPIVGQAMLALLPSALALTIPMSLLLGLLVAFGRLSGDREFVALQACGVSIMRLLRPVAVMSLLAASATAYMWMAGMPAGNMRFNQIAFEVITSLAQNEVKPRVFFDRFPQLTVWVQDIPRAGGWSNVFMADSRSPQGTVIYLAKRGEVNIDRPRQRVELVLHDATRHGADDKGGYDVLKFKRAVLELDPRTIFPRGGVSKEDREMSIPELSARAAALRAAGESDHNQLFEINAKFAIPFGCLVFGLIGLALGATNRRDGTLAGFVVGVVVVFIYYALLELGRAMAKGHLVPPWAGAWLPDMVLGCLGIALFVLRRKIADQPLRLPVPRMLRRGGQWRPGRLLEWLPITLLDRYVIGTYGRILGLAFLALASVFYISTFVDQSEKVFKGQATWEMFGLFMLYSTPQYLYFIIPLSILVATLTSVALLTKSSELIVMRACGISLYRTSVPMIVSAIVAAGAIFAIEQTVLGPSNRKVEQFRLMMRGQSPDLLDINRRTWVLGNDGDIYNYNFFDPKAHRFTRLSVFEFTPGMERITRRTFAGSATSTGGASEFDPSWQLDNGWTREFNEDGEGPYTPFEHTQKRLEPVAHFTSEAQMPQFMSYTELRAYTDRLDAGGADVIAQRAVLARKASFPFVTLVMTLIAVPFAVTIGRSGAMAGIGVAIAVAIAYWVTSSVFGALGAGGVMPPQLAAWSPNLLFGAGAIYLLFTVRT